MNIEKYTHRFERFMRLLELVINIIEHIASFLYKMLRDTVIIVIFLPVWWIVNIYNLANNIEYLKFPKFKNNLMYKVLKIKKY